MSSKIYHNDMKWTIDDDVWNATATSNAAKYSYALGKHEWLITGDDVSCHNGEPYKTFLKLTGCLDGDFTRDDGQCVRCGWSRGATSFQIVTTSLTRWVASCLC